MYSMQQQPSLFMTTADHHIAAAEEHERAATSHRNAAALYEYGNYQEANEQGRFARDCGDRAIQSCDMAMK